MLLNCNTAPSPAWCLAQNTSQAFAPHIVPIIEYDASPEILSGTAWDASPEILSGAAWDAAPDKTLYLTFDDGPSARYTPSLLDLLDDLHIPASFFVVGDFAAKNPEILRRMASSGHTIGLHSYFHKSAYLMTRTQAKKDFEKSMAVLHSMDIKPHLFRPPWGHTRAFTLELARELGLSPVYWTVMAQDWKAFQTPAGIARRLLERTNPGSVICLHDGRGRNGAPARTICALKSVLPILLDQGYRFCTVSNDTCPEPQKHSERKSV